VGAPAAIVGAMRPVLVEVKPDLEVVPDRVVRSNEENFEAAIQILPHPHKLPCSGLITTKIIPVPPAVAVTRHTLRRMPDNAIVPTSNQEQLEATPDISPYC